jgi:glycosyltransferase involved in cell wall biosynthesis
MPELLWLAGNCSTLHPLLINAMEFSVAIRTYNRVNQLCTLLDALKAQIQTQPFPWEIVLVDNNSTDNTAAVVQQYQADWPSHIPLRYILEPQQGAAIARRRAIEECQGKLIGFLDDDNVPTPDWVAKAYQFAQTHPQAVAFGGKNLPVFNTEPPEGFHRIQAYFAIVDRGEQPRPYAANKGLLPPGAGLVIQRQPWLEHVPHPNKLKLQGPTQQQIPTKGEDMEALSYLVKAGREVWYTPDMVMHHHISADRLQPEYLLHFFQTMGTSSHPFRMARFAPWQRFPMTCLYLASDLYKFLRFKIQHRQSQDLITSCQQTMILGSILSPFSHKT